MQRRSSLALAAALPALAATPVYKGTVGPGLHDHDGEEADKAGKVRIVVADKSSIHNFHLTGPGVNVKTSVSAIGTKTFTVTLKKGTYKFVCDPHAVHEGLVHRQVARGGLPGSRLGTAHAAAPRRLQRSTSAAAARSRPRRSATRRARRSARCRSGTAAPPRARCSRRRSARAAAARRRASGRPPGRRRGRSGRPRRAGRSRSSKW